MVGATTTANLAGTSNESQSSPHLLPSETPKRFLCTTCHISFQNGQEQRSHSKEPWHVYNIKRRIASLDPISQEAFEKKLDPSRTQEDDTISASSSSSEDSQPSSYSPFDCLFCPMTFDTSPTAISDNLTHMHTAHGLSIPSPDTLSDMQIFLSYLATEIRKWHECLYCGATKESTTSIQSHMRDKGHCRLNFDREPELLEFWENPSGDEDEAEVSEEEDHEEASARPTILSDTEMRFPSGRVIESRHSLAGPAGTKPIKKASRKQGSVGGTTPTSVSISTTKAITQGSPSADTEETQSFVQPQKSSGQQLAIRRREVEMSLVGISAQQQRALVTATIKAQRSDQMARRAREWVVASKSNSQKFDQLDNQRKWGKQNHKLLPR